MFLEGGGTLGEGLGEGRGESIRGSSLGRELIRLLFMERLVCVKVVEGELVCCECT